MHLAECAERIAEVLEGCATNDEVERSFRKRQRRGVALAEIDLDAGACSIFGGDADERATDVDPGDTVGAQSSQLDRQLAWSRGDFKHRSAGPKPYGNAFGQAAEFRRALCRVLGVPGCDHPFHGDALVGLNLSRSMDFHDRPHYHLLNKIITN